MVNKASRNAGNVPVFYYERQRGGLCRLHAINAFLGSAIYSEAQFNDEMDKFDTEKRRLYGERAISCTQYDTAFGTENNLISYILGKRGIYLKYVPIGQARLEKAEAIKSVFLLNATHIWVAKWKDGKWWSIDSIGGIGSVTALDSSIGMLIPCADNMREFLGRCDVLSSIIGPDPISWCSRVCSEQKNMCGVDEVLAAIAHILSIQSRFCQVPAATRILAQYEQFAVGFAGLTKDSIFFVTKHVPPLIGAILAFAAHTRAT